MKQKRMGELWSLSNSTTPYIVDAGDIAYVDRTYDV